MERLTKHWGNNYIATKLNYDFLWEMPNEDFKHFEAIIKKLAEYEDLEEQGKLIRVCHGNVAATTKEEALKQLGL